MVPPRGPPLFNDRRGVSFVSPGRREGDGPRGRGRRRYSRLPLRRIIVEPLLRDAVAAPGLIGKLVEDELLPVRLLDIEHPAHDDAIAVDGIGRARTRGDRPNVLEDGLLVRRQGIAPGTRRAEVFLHGGVFGVELADRLDVLARLHHGDEGLHPFLRRH